MELDFDETAGDVTGRILEAGTGRLMAWVPPTDMARLLPRARAFIAVLCGKGA